MIEQKKILEKIEALDINQENHEYYEWFLKLGKVLIEEKNNVDVIDRYFILNIDKGIRDCLYLIDRRWNYALNLKEFAYNEHLIINFYYNHLLTLPYRGVPFIIAIYFKLESLLKQQMDHVIDSNMEYDWSEVDNWFSESCQLTAIAKFLKIKKEEICLEIPLSIVNTARKSSRT